MFSVSGTLYTVVKKRVSLTLFSVELSGGGGYCANMPTHRLFSLINFVLFKLLKTEVQLIYSVVSGTQHSDSVCFADSIPPYVITRYWV